jgi:hypothetical protein
LDQTLHQTAALGSYNTNLPRLIGYCDNQVADLYNNTMKKAVPNLQEILGNITKLIIFSSMPSSKTSWQESPT